jgi:hypothetical protein
MRGGLRRPRWPFQVCCVLAAVLLTAVLSLQFVSAERAGGRPVPDKPNPGSLGERLNADTISIVSGDPNATDLDIAYDLSAQAVGGNQNSLL